jgi:hypothetical protein
MFPPDMGWDVAHVQVPPWSTQGTYPMTWLPDPLPSGSTITTWPTVVFKDPAHPSGIWNPPCLLCPSDVEPAGNHSYCLNDHFIINPKYDAGHNNVRYSSGKGDLNGLEPSDCILLGEKVSTRADYYMEVGDFADLVEKYRHGIAMGSNYLYLDLHVDDLGPNQAVFDLALDPWAITPLSSGAPTSSN